MFMVIPKQIYGRGTKIRFSFLRHLPPINKKVTISWSAVFNIHTGAHI